MSTRTVFPAVVSFLFLVGCQGATETLPPPSTAPTFVVPATETPVPTATLPIIAFPSATRTAAPGRAPRSPTPRPLRTATPTKPRATATRPTATRAATAAPPDHLLDGDYASSGTVRIQFKVSDGGTLAYGGYFNYRCPVDNALSTYGFTEPAAIVGGKFAFSALPSPSLGPQVTMVCTAITLTQARCTLRNRLATDRCLDTPATANRK